MSTEGGATERFRGRSVLVTGGAGGIGEAIARRFLAAGAEVAVIDRDAHGLRGLAEEFTEVRTVTADLAEPAALDGALAPLDDAGWVADIVVNNVAGLTPVAFHEASDEEIERDIALTLSLPLRLTRRVLPRLIARGGGVIVNVASVNGLGAYGNEVYSAAKAGLIGFTRSIAVEYADRGVRCNAVAPGSIRTAAWDARVEADPDVLDRAAAWYPLGRVGAPSDVAESVLFLASDEASWITGVCVAVDGGLTAGNLAMARDITADIGRRDSGR